MFAYEVPLFMGLFAPALLADSWTISDISQFYIDHPAYGLFNIIGFVVSLVALLGKLEKAPFDIPEAETEIVAGTFTEYSGRLYAFFRLSIDIEMVVGASLLASVFLPFGLKEEAVIGFFVYLLKVLLVVFLLTLARTIFARLRIDQMVRFCWKYLVPLALVQLLVILFVKGVVLQ
jgi:NADH-quinone oxidoreductase subunit H